MRSLALCVPFLALVGLHAAASPPAADAPSGVVVHEWGTFSTFSGSDGRNLKFEPYDNDLPEFVQSYYPRNAKARPGGGTISLETPVLYFYSDRPLTASVRVDFPKGTLTEWYPRARWQEHRLSWTGVNVRPGADGPLPKERTPSRYYAARETDATPLTVIAEADGKPVTDREKFLFYRGVGSFVMPLTVRAHGGGRFSVRWTGKDPIGDLLLLRVEAGKVGYRRFALESAGQNGWEADVQAPERGSADELGAELRKLLVGRGLFEKEARAMVETWRSAWFGEEGERVLYFLPDRLTKELLPLQVEPQPAEQLRVLVGRHDVLTPEREKQIDKLVREAGENGPGGQRQRAARDELAKLGRYWGAAQGAAEERLARGR